MKDSGVEWIGEIPEEWRQDSLQTVLRSPITDGPHETPIFLDEGIPFISVDSLSESDQVNKNIIKGYISEEDYNTYNRKAKISEGDILFTKAATIGKTAIVDDWKFMVWSPLAIIKNNKRVLNKYLYYILSSSAFIEYVIRQGTSNTQVNVGMRTLQKSRIPLCTIEKQRKLVNILDTSCLKIDHLIALQEKMIAQLQAYKQSVITEAVTKGLDPGASMKDSGVDWIGRIPKNWEINKLKRIIKKTANGITRRGVFSEEGNIVLKLRNIDSDSSSINYADVNRFELSANELRQYQLVENDLLFVRVNGSKDLVGKVAIYKNIGESVIYNDHIIKVQLHEGYDVRHILYYLISLFGRTEIGLLVKTSAGQYTINGDDIRSMNFLLIPLSEWSAPNLCTNL